jgi:hypothetical protein
MESPVRETRFAVSAALRVRGADATVRKDPRSRGAATDPVRHARSHERIKGAFCHSGGRP